MFDNTIFEKLIMNKKLIDLVSLKLMDVFIVEKETIELN